MSEKKKSIIVLCIVFAVLLISGGVVTFLFLSNKDHEVIAGAENSYNPEYMSFSKYEQHPDIAIDGVLKEECWQNKKWFENTFYNNVSGTMPRVRYTAFPTEYGAYVAAVAEDTNLVSNGQRGGNNSAFVFTIGAYSVGEAFAEDGGLGNVSLTIDMREEMSGYNTNIERAVTVDGELNSGATKGAVLEVFIPWKFLYIDIEKGTPTEVYLLPKYKAVVEGTEAAATILPMSPRGNTIIYYRFDENGYTHLDADNAIVGDSILGNVKDATWDISKEPEGIIESSPKAEYHNIFFKDKCGSNFIIETTIIPVKQHYDWAHAGIIFHKTETPSSQFYTVMLPMEDSILVNGAQGTKNFPNFKLTTVSNYDGWTQRVLNVREEIDNQAQSQVGVKLTVVKYGGELWYFANGKFLAYEEHSYLDDNVLPGLFAINADAIFKNYSCEEIDEKQLEEYLTKRGINRIDMTTKGGGKIVSSKGAVVNGEAYELTLTAKSGYRLTSLKINGTEKMSDVKKKAVQGVYTVYNVRSHQEIVAVYEKTDGVTFQGQVMADKKGVKAEVCLTGVNEKELRYLLTSAEKGGFKATVPAGKYQVLVTSDGCKRTTKTITLKQNTKQDFQLALSDFAPEVTVNDKKVSSRLNRWNFEEELQNKVSGTYSNNFSSAPLYFRNGVGASDFVASVTIDYTTEFKDGVDYQPDLMGGFIFHDGTNSAFMWARDTGVITTGWKYHMGLRPDAVLMKENPRTAVVTVAKSGDKLYLYFDNVFAREFDWSVVAPKIAADSKVAVGLYAHTDKNADIQFSNWSIKTGKSAAEQYIRTHKLQNILLKANPKFAEALVLNGKQIKSKVSYWKLDQVANNVIMGSQGFTGYNPTLYFAETGQTALLEATIEYTTQFKDGVDYQKDLFGGFSITDGTKNGWLAANDTGIAYTGWKFQRGLLAQSVLTYPEARPVKMTLAIYDDYVYVFLNDRFITRKSMDDILPGRKEGADLAFSIFANADKACDYKFSGVNISTDEDVVKQFIDKHI